MREMGYAVLDVFAERRFEGNQLAVFADGSGLTEVEMQTIAREMNLSETVFCLPRAAEVERERGVRVRIFTTEEELPFAGHPTLGAATWVRMEHPEFCGEAVIRLEENVGTIPVRFAEEEDGRPGMFGTMRQNDPVFGEVGGEGWPTRAEFAEALGLREDEIGLAGAEGVPVQVVSTGTAFCVVPVRSAEVLGRLEIRQARARGVLRRIGARFFYCVTRVEAAGDVMASDGAGRAAWRGRMQFGGGEDPATGSAAGCVAAWLVEHGLAESGGEVVLEQGIEMLRPSRLTIRATKAGGAGRITDVFVGGRTIPVARGRLLRG